MLMVFLNGIPTICFAFSMLLSVKYKVFVEFLGPSLYGAYTVIVALAYY